MYMILSDFFGLRRVRLKRSSLLRKEVSDVFKSALTVTTACRWGIQSTLSASG